jgi:hypothetical protein
MSNNCKKVIFVSHAHLTDKRRSDYYINYLLDKGIAVEYWDLVPLLFGEMDEFSAQAVDFLYSPRSYEEIKKMLAFHENRDVIYIIHINYGHQYLKLYRLLNKYNCKIWFLSWGGYPSSSVSISRKILRRFSNPLKLIGNVFNKINCIAHKKLKLVKPFDVVLGAGYTILKTFPDAIKVIPVNTADYDHYVRVRSQECQFIEGDYAVFLDINLPDQSDIKTEGLPLLDSDKYYASLNHFFQLLETKYNVKVVIAAHPKANYAEEIFEGREIISGRTPELIKDAVFAISHHSTSVSYAVLNIKPIIFIYTEMMMQMYKNTRVKQIYDFAFFLGATVCNIDEITQEDQIFIEDVKLNRYEDYKYSFLTTHESESTTTQEVFWREVNSLQ